MAEKISMIIILVDLDCYKCYNKMRKILCQLQYQERIRTISFDDKSKTITIVGPFDPQIRCKGGKVVKDVHIVDEPPQMMDAGPPPAKSGKHKNKDKPPTSEPPPPAPPTPPPEMPPSSPVPVRLPQPCRPVERPVEYVIPTVEIPSCPAPPVGPCGCPCCAPCYQGCYDGCRCCCCGQVSYGSARPLLLPAGGACGYGYRGCRTFCHDDPSAACSVM
ncbi:hypothetical protein BS78_K129100 [Paspalum vaginatum]|uniref:HMA domain-containing protein n=1 Tax=Paspalum vaginatum TaxID=158149 RepID=A0A9W7XC84_9POAL|nr:hypothetical protein BS78_K129100 [Paspalum vaginatum]